MGITNTDPKVGGLSQLPEHKQKAMVDSYAAFYGCEDDKKVSKLTYNKLYQASRERKPVADPSKNVPKDMLNDPAFKHSQKVFFQEKVSDTAS